MLRGSHQNAGLMKALQDTKPMAVKYPVGQQVKSPFVGERKKRPADVAKGA